MSTYLTCDMADAGHKGFSDDPHATSGVIYRLKNDERYELSRTSHLHTYFMLAYRATRYEIRMMGMPTLRAEQNKSLTHLFMLAYSPLNRRGSCDLQSYHLESITYTPVL